MPETAFATPCFDLELFLQTLGEPRLGGGETDECLALWDRWGGLLSRVFAEAGGRRYLAVWLGEDVETAVDEAWDASPSRGFLLHALAQTLCMCAVHEQVPEVEDAGCAPVPAPSGELAEALTAAGLPARAETGLTLARRYAVVTRFPFAVGFDGCAGAASCPRSGGANESFFEIG